jgi:RNase H-fold protein (predicted Holliday junction resolvase)
MDGKLSALESQIKHNDSLQVLLMDSIMTTRIAESVINIKESQINTSKTKEINDILTATPMQIDTMYESAYYRAMQRYRSGTLYIQR